MKNLFILLAIVSITFGFGSCRDQKTETESTHTKEIIREVKVKEPKKEGALERAAEKVDKKVNEKIDEAIDEID